MHNKIRDAVKAALEKIHDKTPGETFRSAKQADNTLAYGVSPYSFTDTEKENSEKGAN